MSEQFTRLTWQADRYHYAAVRCDLCGHGRSTFVDGNGITQLDEWQKLHGRQCPGTNSGGIDAAPTEPCGPPCDPGDIAVSTVDDVVIRRLP